VARDVDAAQNPVRRQRHQVVAAADAAV